MSCTGAGFPEDDARGGLCDGISRLLCHEATPKSPKTPESNVKILIFGVFRGLASEYLALARAKGRGLAESPVSRAGTEAHPSPT